MKAYFHPLKITVICIALLTCSSVLFPAIAEVLSIIQPGSPQTENQRLFSRLAAGIQVEEEPEQHALNDFKWIQHGEYQLGLTDYFLIQGVILSIHRYDISHDDDISDISPLDIVIGWQKMSNPAVLSQIHIEQDNRFYFWHVDEFPIPRHEIELYSTNLHLIPHDTAIREKLFTLKPGDIISLQGHLTDVKKPDGFIWSTSRVRNDAGDGACEILLVRHLSLIRSLTENTDQTLTQPQY